MLLLGFKLMFKDNLTKIWCISCVYTHVQMLLELIYTCQTFGCVLQPQEHLFLPRTCLCNFNFQSRTLGFTIRFCIILSFFSLLIAVYKVGSLIMKEVGHVFLPALVGDRLLLSFVISDPTLIQQLEVFIIIVIRILL